MDLGIALSRAMIVLFCIAHLYSLGYRFWKKISISLCAASKRGCLRMRPSGMYVSSYRCTFWRNWCVILAIFALVTFPLEIVSHSRCASTNKRLSAFDHPLSACRRFRNGKTSRRASATCEAAINEAQTNAYFCQIAQAAMLVLEAIARIVATVVSYRAREFR